MSTLRFGHDGMLALVGKRMSDSELFALQLKVLSGDPDARQEFIYQMVPGANKIASRITRNSERDIGDDLAGFAYQSIVDAVDRYKPRSAPMKQFVFFCVNRQLKRRIRMLVSGTTGLSGVIAFDQSPSPDDMVGDSDESGRVISFIHRKIGTGGRHWMYLGRYYGIAGNRPENIMAIAANDKVSKQWVSLNIRKAIGFARKSLATRTQDNREIA